MGGGGLISGIAGYLKSMGKNVEIIGCQPENSAVLYESIKAETMIGMGSKPAISDGTAGGVESGAITFAICKHYVDGYVLVTEEEIKETIRLVLEKHHILMEGTGALSVSSFIKAREKFGDRNVILVLSGVRLGVDTLREVLSMRVRKWRTSLT